MKYLFLNHQYFDFISYGYLMEDSEVKHIFAIPSGIYDCADKVLHIMDKNNLSVLKVSMIENGLFDTFKEYLLKFNDNLSIENLHIKPERDY